MAPKKTEKNQFEEAIALIDDALSSPALSAHVGCALEEARIQLARALILESKLKIAKQKIREIEDALIGTTIVNDLLRSAYREGVHSPFDREGR